METTVALLMELEHALASIAASIANMISPSVIVTTIALSLPVLYSQYQQEYLQYARVSVPLATVTLMYGVVALVVAVLTKLLTMIGTII